MLHAALHREENLSDRGDILTRVRRQEDDVRQLARFQGAHLTLRAHAYRADEGGRTDGVHRSHANFAHQDFDFTLQSGIRFFRRREAVGACGNQDSMLVGLRRE